MLVPGPGKRRMTKNALREESFRAVVAERNELRRRLMVVEALDPYVHFEEAPGLRRPLLAQDLVRAAIHGDLTLDQIEQARGETSDNLPALVAHEGVIEPDHGTPDGVVRLYDSG